MTWLPRAFLLALTAAFVVNAPACKSEEKKDSGKKGGDEDAEGTRTRTRTNTNDRPSDGEEQTNTNTDPCRNSSTKTKTKTATNSGDEDMGIGLRGNGLSLTDKVSYDGDVKSILGKYCTGCHGSGGKDPDLSSYSAAKSNIDAALSSIDAGDMPKGGGTVASGDLAKLKQWVTDGKPQSASTTSSTDGATDDSETDGSGTDGSNGGGSSSDCDKTNTGSTTDTSDDGSDLDDAWQELLNPPQLKECHDQNHVYDRGKQKCHKSTIATSFECTPQGIKDKFKKLAVTVNVSADGKTIAGFEGYDIDQCGEFENQPVVFFYKKVEGSTDEVKLEIKMLCKKGSAACER